LLILEMKIEIDIGEPSRAFPVTPPCVRVRTRRFGWLSSRSSSQGWQAERLEVSIGQSEA
jgi:hypothetical protein